MVQGDGPTVGAAISAHPDIDFVSFTGSTRAGREIAKAGAESIKRVAQELGGKSANIVLDDADLEKAVRGGVQSCFMNSGQSCNAPTRMFVPEAKHADALRIAKETAEATVAGGAIVLYARCGEGVGSESLTQALLRPRGEFLDDAHEKYALNNQTAVSLLGNVYIIINDIVGSVAEAAAIEQITERFRVSKCGPER